jgi:hypothetical protein
MMVAASEGGRTDQGGWGVRRLISLLISRGHSAQNFDVRLLLLAFKSPGNIRASLQKRAE